MAMMQLGFVSAIVPELNLQQVIELASSIGYQTVELMCWPPSKADRRYAGVTHINVLELDESKVSSIRKMLESHRVSISGLG
jgi:sugar phosphate isomerase/epimerase